MSTKKRDEITPIEVVKGFSTIEPTVSISGWVSPTNSFISCLYTQHDILANKLGFTESELENMGWLKVSNGRVHPTETTTNEQIIFAKKVIK